MPSCLLISTIKPFKMKSNLNRKNLSLYEEKFCERY